MWTVNFQMFKLDLEEAEESDQIANIHWIIKKNLQTINIREGVKKREPSYTVGGV